MDKQEKTILNGRYKIIRPVGYGGMAQAVCAALDSLHWEGTVGTLAGDDTIFILTRTENIAAGLVAELKKLLA